jgi:carbonic anhydrase
MTESENRNLDRLLSRRSFVTTSTAAAAIGLLSACNSKADETKPAEIPAAPQEPVIVALTKEARDQMTPDSIIAKLKDGNTRFREGRKIPRDFLAEQRATASGQYPAAVLLSCVDSRAPAEILFNLGMGDVFNARVAGNIENPDILVLVMGHSACGAVAGAIANAKLGNLTQLLAKIQPAIKATKFDGDRTANNPEFVDAVARTNIDLTIANIRKNSKVIADLEKAGTIKIAGAFYDLKTGAVEFSA